MGVGNGANATRGKQHDFFIKIVCGMFFSSQGEVREGASQKREVALDSRCSPQKNVCNLFLLTKLCYVSLCLLIYPYASATHAPPFSFFALFFLPLALSAGPTFLPACTQMAKTSTLRKRDVTGNRPTARESLVSILGTCETAHSTVC